MDNEENKNKSKLDSLRQRIYSRSNPPRRRGRRLFRSYNEPVLSTDVPKELIDETQDGISKDNAVNLNPENNKDMAQDANVDSYILDNAEDRGFWTAPKIFLFVSVIFFFFSIGLAYFFIIKGINEVNQNKIAMVVNGPSYIKSGDTLKLQIAIENQNNAALELTDLVVDYPPGTIIPGVPYKVESVDYNGSIRRVVRERKSLNSIGAHELKRGIVSARLYGKKDDTKDITIKLQYRVKGSNAVFEISKIYPIRFSSDALSINVEGPTEALFGQKPKLKIYLKNTSADNLLNIALKAQLPLGVKIIKSDPELKNNMWEFPILEPGEEKEIDILMQVDGQTGDERVLKFVAGMIDSNANVARIDSPFQQVDHKLVIKRPFLFTQLNISGNKNNDFFVVQPGSQFEASLEWLNTLPKSMEDLVLALTLKGDALDKYKVKPGSGFYKSKDNLIIWDKTTVGRIFEKVPAGAKGKLTFKLGVKDTPQLIRVINPSFTATLHASANRLSTQGTQNTLTAFLEKEIRVKTDLTVNMRSLYFSNPLKSAGALPPKADKPTIYGIEWEVKNSTNLVKNAEITGYLPPNVEWGKVFLPATESVEYNPTTGQIKWNLGDIKPGTGYYLPSRKVFFNVVITPSGSQIGQSPTLINNQIFKGLDVFTNTDITKNLKNVDTKIQEPQGNEFYYRVVK